MAILRPTFSLTIGSLQSTSDNPAGGPVSIRIERDMDIPADAAEVHLVDRSGIAVGDAMAIRLGHDGSEETVFTGSVAAIRPAIAGTVVRGLGTMNGLLNLRAAATYENQAAGAIARDLIGQAGLAAGTVDDGPTLPVYAVDSRLSAYAHLRELAERLGYELYADRDGNIRFHALGAAAGLDALGGGIAGALPALGGESYRYGQHLLAADARRRDPPWGKITVGGESPMSGQGDTTAYWLTVNDADYRGTAGDSDPGLLLLDPAARTQDLADRFAAGRLAAAKRSAHEIAITVLGRAAIDLGDTLEVGDVPDDLVDGSGYVRAIRHRFGAQVGFVTDLRIALDADA